MYVNRLLKTFICSMRYKLFSFLTEKAASKHIVIISPLDWKMKQQCWKMITLLDFVNYCACNLKSNINYKSVQHREPSTERWCRSISLTILMAQNVPLRPPPFLTGAKKTDTDIGSDCCSVIINTCCYYHIKQLHCPAEIQKHNADY